MIPLTHKLPIHLTPAAAGRRGLPEVRESKLLPASFKTRIANLDILKQENPQFKALVDGKIHHFGKNMQFYAYTSEGVEDTSWGCAWRAIQTMLSTHYNGDVNQIPGFKDLYKSYCTHDFMKEQYAQVYPKNASENRLSWKAPEDDWHMWADPFVGQMILHSLGIDSTLFAVNTAPKVLSPNENDATYSFAEFRERMVSHFEKSGAPLFIDNGKFAMNILGVGTGDAECTYLLIGDPHLLFERNEHPLNGLYTVELDKDGNKIAVDYPQKSQHFHDDENGYSYNKIDFSPNTQWLITQSLQYH